MVVPLIIMVIIGADTHTEIIECYDKYGNMIIGMVCEDEVYNDEFTDVLISYIHLFFLAGFGLFFISLVFYLFDDLRK